MKGARKGDVQLTDIRTINDMAPTSSSAGQTEKCPMNKACVMMSVICVIGAIVAGVGLGYAIFPLVKKSLANVPLANALGDLKKPIPNEAAIEIQIDEDTLQNEDVSEDMPTRTDSVKKTVNLDIDGCGKLYSDEGELTKGRIVGGQRTSIQNHPWQVSLWTLNRHTCGGSIIGSNWVLTAAHCTQPYPHPQNWTVYAGATYLSEMRQLTNDTQIIFLTRVFTHENFDSYTFNNDIALMQLDRHLEMNSKISSICLASSTQQVSAGRECFISGWGSLIEGGGTPNDLQEARVRILDRNMCNEDNWLMDMLTDVMICAGTEDGSLDACQGDSGGPLSCLDSVEGKYFLAGAVSWGIGCGQPKWPGVYTHIGKFRDWIEKTVLKP